MRQLSEHVWQLDRSLGANGYVIANGPRCVVIDPGVAVGARRVLAELAEARDVIGPVTDVVLTHSDSDHAGAAAAVCARTGGHAWIGKPDGEFLRGGIAPATRVRRALTALGKPRLPRDTTEFDGDEPLEIIPELWAIATPGHTPGHVAYRYRNILFCGDAAVLVKGRLMPSRPLLNSDQDTADKSLALLRQLPVQYVCPGHGAPGELTDVA